jgi:hypothetical protein
MPGLVPGIHVFTDVQRRKTWMAGTSPALTKKATHFQDLREVLKMLAAFPARL